MGNLREAVRAQSRDVWERTPDDQEKWWKKYLRGAMMVIAGRSHSISPSPSAFTIAACAAPAIEVSDSDSAARDRRPDRFAAGALLRH
jgi:membrane protein